MTTVYKTREIIPPSNNGGEIIIEKVRMKKTLGIFSCVSILCSLTGHVAVFAAPTAILIYTGSYGLSIIIWLLGGLMNLMLALCFTELAVMFPKAGGPYNWSKEVLGPLPGFMILWGYVVLITGPFWAFQAYCASSYILQLVYVGCDPPDVAIKLVAIWITVTFVALNCVYVKLVTKVQYVLTLTKVLALSIIIICGIIRACTDGYDNIATPFEETITDPVVVAMSFFYSVFMYGGWQILSNLMEEVTDPGRDIPRAVFIGISLIILQYCLVNVAYYVVIPKQELLQSTTVAVLFFEHFYPPMKPVISCLVAITAIGVLNASVLGHSRLLFAGARSGQAPVFLSMLSLKFFTPWPAIMVIMIWSLIMLLSGKLFTLIEMISVCSSLLSLVVIIILLYLRWTQPNAPRPYKNNIAVPVSMLILVVVMLLLCMYKEPEKLGLGLGIMLAGFPVYLVGVKWKSKPEVYNKFMNRLTIVVQKAFYVVKSH